MPLEEDEQTKVSADKEKSEAAGKNDAESSAYADSRSERKRNREQKRRDDVNKGLEQLTKMVFVIDPQLKAAAEDRAKKSHGRTAVPESQLLSRVELVTSAVATMGRVHQENEMRKVIIAQLSRDLAAARGGSGAAPSPEMMAAAAGAQDLSAAAAGLGAAGLGGIGFYGSMMGSALQGMGALAQQQREMTEETVAEAAAARSKQGEEPEEAKAAEKGPTTKRMKTRQGK